MDVLGKVLQLTPMMPSNLLQRSEMKSPRNEFFHGNGSNNGHTPSHQRSYCYDSLFGSVTKVTPPVCFYISYTLAVIQY